MEDELGRDHKEKPEARGGGEGEGPAGGLLGRAVPADVEEEQSPTNAHPIVAA
ncbi:hypothetical protein [Streptomyces sp. SR-10]|uniref:hypothetical protein n=1 Tax=Streptomyces sp. SR-10 TaxID=3416442 RepID=UPI003CF40B5B